MKWLADKKLLTVTLNRQRGAAWYLEGTDGSGAPAFRYLVIYGGKHLAVLRLALQGRASNPLGDLRDKVVMPAKKICETHGVVATEATGYSADEPACPISSLLASIGRPRSPRSSGRSTSRARSATRSRPDACTTRFCSAARAAAARPRSRASSARRSTARTGRRPATAEPCGECGACTSIANGSAVDYQEMDGASNRGIDAIRELTEAVRYQPAVLRKKVYVIDEVHMLTTEAFNALLKTLEEPPPHVTFVLATTEPHKLPNTILSRCQRYDFKLVPASRLAQHLASIFKQEKLKIDAGAISLRRPRVRRQRARCAVAVRPDHLVRRRRRRSRRSTSPRSSASPIAR